MSKLLLLFTLLLLTGCGSDIKIDTEEATYTFEGVFSCNNGSYIELERDQYGKIRFDTSYQKLVSQNPRNDSFGTHPIISDSNLEVIGKLLIIRSRNYNYSSSTHDLEEDENGSNITGNRQTDLLVYLEKGDIVINIKIWDNAMNSNINEIVAERNFTCKRL